MSTIGKYVKAGIKLATLAAIAKRTGLLDDLNDFKKEVSYFLDRVEGKKK